MNAPAVLPQMLALNVPIDPELIKELWIEAFMRVARERDEWFTFEEAAEHLKISLRTLHRNRGEWGLPISELSDGIKRVLRADVDALLRAHLVKPDGESVLDFPSLHRSRRYSAGPLLKVS